MKINLTHRGQECGGIERGKRINQWSRGSQQESSNWISTRKRVTKTRAWQPLTLPARSSFRISYNESTSSIVLALNTEQRPPLGSSSAVLRHQKTGGENSQSQRASSSAHQRKVLPEDRCRTVHIYDEGNQNQTVCQTPKSTA
jgi:hypothetical protein